MSRPAGRLPSQRDRGNPDIHDLPSTAQCQQFQTYIGIGASVRKNLRLWQQHDHGAYDHFLRERLGSAVVSLHALATPNAARRIAQERQQHQQRQRDAHTRDALAREFREARGRAALEDLTK